MNMLHETFAKKLADACTAALANEVPSTWEWDSLAWWVGFGADYKAAPDRQAADGGINQACTDGGQIAPPAIAPNLGSINGLLTGGQVQGIQFKDGQHNNVVPAISNNAAAQDGADLVVTIPDWHNLNAAAHELLAWSLLPCTHRPLDLPIADNRAPWNGLHQEKAPTVAQDDFYWGWRGDARPPRTPDNRGIFQTGFWPKCKSAQGDGWTAIRTVVNSMEAHPNEDVVWLRYSQKDLCMVMSIAVANRFKDAVVFPRTEEGYWDRHPNAVLAQGQLCPDMPRPAVAQVGAAQGGVGPAHVLDNQPAQEGATTYIYAINKDKTKVVDTAHIQSRIGDDDHPPWAEVAMNHVAAGEVRYAVEVQRYAQFAGRNRLGEGLFRVTKLLFKNGQPSEVDLLAQQVDPATLEDRLGPLYDDLRPYLEGQSERQRANVAQRKTCIWRFRWTANEGVTNRGCNPPPPTNPPNRACAILMNGRCPLAPPPPPAQQVAPPQPQQQPAPQPAPQPQQQPAPPPAQQVAPQRRGNWFTRFFRKLCWWKK